MANEHQHFIFLLNLLNGIGVRRFVWPWPRHATTNISMPLPPDNLIHARMTDCICLPESIIEIMWICVSHFANKYKTIQLKCFASARPKESSRKRKPKKTRTVIMNRKTGFVCSIVVLMVRHYTIFVLNHHIYRYAYQY